MRSKDSEELFLADKRYRIDLIDPHDHSLDDYETVVDESNDYKTQGEFLHGRQSFRLESTIKPTLFSY